MLFIFSLVLVNGLELSMQTNQASLKLTPIGSAINLMTELPKKDMRELEDQLLILRDSIQQKILDEQQSLDQSLGISNSDKEFYETILTKHQAELAKLNIELRFQEKNQKVQETKLSKLLADVEMIKQQRQRLQSMQDKDKLSYTAKDSQLNKGLQTIDEAIKLLESAKQTSFIETHSENYGAMGQSLKEILESQYHLIAYSLMEIEEFKFADQEVIRRSIKTLRKIRDSISDSKLKLLSSFTGQNQQNTKLFQLYDNKLTNLNTQIATIQEQYKQTCGAVKIKKEIIESITDSVTNAIKLLQSIDEEIRQRAEMSLVDEYQQELDIIQKCIDTLKQ